MYQNDCIENALGNFLYGSIDVKRCKEEIEHCVANGADINKNYPINRLSLCDKANGCEVVKCLLKCQADPNKRGVLLVTTVLMDAVIANRTDMVQLLIECKADVNLLRSARDLPSRTALDYALESCGLLSVITSKLLDAGGKLSGKCFYNAEELASLHRIYKSRHWILWDLFGNDVAGIIFGFIDDSLKL